MTDYEIQLLSSTIAKNIETLLRQVIREEMTSTKASEKSELSLKRPLLTLPKMKGGNNK